MKRIIYANSNHDNRQYINEAAVSAQSFRRHVRDCEIVLYTNERDFTHDAFDRVEYSDFVVPTQLESRMHKNGQMLVKQRAMIDTYADRNLVLGSDTLALSDNVGSAFDLLDRFDIAVAHAPGRISRAVPDVPIAYPEFNCDVIFFRKTPATTDFFTRWHEMYAADSFNHPHDQGTFRYLAYHSDLKIAVLPFEYNDRVGLFGDQASATERRRNKPVIVQNREVIAKILAGDSDWLGSPRQPQKPKRKAGIAALLRRALRV
jgi:hypothetical protein